MLALGPAYGLASSRLLGQDIPQMLNESQSWGTGKSMQLTQCSCRNAGIHWLPCPCVVWHWHPKEWHLIQWFAVLVIPEAVECYLCMSCLSGCFSPGREEFCRLSLSHPTPWLIHHLNNHAPLQSDCDNILCVISRHRFGHHERTWESDIHQQRGLQPIYAFLCQMALCPCKTSSTVCKCQDKANRRPPWPKIAPPEKFTNHLVTDIYVGTFLRLSSEWADSGCSLS